MLPRLRLRIAALALAGLAAAAAPVHAKSLTPQAFIEQWDADHDGTHVVLGCLSPKPGGPLDAVALELPVVPERGDQRPGERARQTLVALRVLVEHGVGARRRVRVGSPRLGLVLVDEVDEVLERSAFLRTVVRVTFSLSSAPKPSRTISSFGVSAT